jgi:hypothetical protein
MTMLELHCIWSKLWGGGRVRDECVGAVWSGVGEALGRVCWGCLVEALGWRMGWNDCVGLFGLGSGVGEGLG